MASKDYYEILGVGKNATPEEIKKKFRDASKKLHPDVNDAPDAEEKFKELNEAYTVLSDPEKRKRYDMYGSAEDNGGFGGFDDFDPFGFNPFGGYGQRSRRPRVERGEDLRVTLDVDFEDLFYGVHKKLKINKKCHCHRCNGSGSETNETTECQRCHGTGFMENVTRRGNMISRTIEPCSECHGTGNVIKDPCPNCHGTGLEQKKVDVEFDIPAGMIEDAYFVMKGMGSDGPHRGVPGDLLIGIREKPSKNGLKRDEHNNIIYTMEVPYRDLVLGADLEIPYIGGKKKIHIDKGTKSGKVLRLYRMGFPEPNNGVDKGDYILTIECYIPKEEELTEEERNVLLKVPVEPEK